MPSLDLSLLLNPSTGWTATQARRRPGTGCWWSCSRRAVAGASPTPTCGRAASPGTLCMPAWPRSPAWPWPPGSVGALPAAHAVSGDRAALRPHPALSDAAGRPGHGRLRGVFWFRRYPARLAAYVREEERKRFLPTPKAARPARKAAEGASPGGRKKPRRPRNSRAAVLLRRMPPPGNGRGRGIRLSPGPGSGKAHTLPGLHHVCTPCSAAQARPASTSASSPSMSTISHRPCHSRSHCGYWSEFKAPDQRVEDRLVQQPQRIGQSVTFVDDHRTSSLLVSAGPEHLAAPGRGPHVPPGTAGREHPSSPEGGETGS